MYEPIFTDKIEKWQKLAEGLKMLLVRIGSIRFEGTGKFWDKKLCIKT